MLYEVITLTKDTELLNSNIAKLEYAFENAVNVFVSMCNNNNRNRYEIEEYIQNSSLSTLSEP